MLLWLPVCHAQGWVELQLPQPGFYKPDDPLIFLVPADIPAEALQRLSMELDGLDVTSFVSREGDRAIFRPPQPLAYGPHQIRLVEYLPDGNIEERALYNVEVRKNELFRQADVSASINLSSTYRLDSNNLDSDIGKDQQSGGGRFSAKAADGDWQADADMDLIYMSQRDQTANGRRLDLARGVVSFSQGPASVRAGDQTIPGSSMVLSNYARRGVSGNLQLNDLRSELTGFAVRAEPINGFAYWPGTEDGGKRTAGILWTLSPLTQQPERLQITTTYLSGKGGADGSSVTGNDETVSNDAGGVVVDSQIWDQRLHLRGEYARSSTDFDGSGNALDASSDYAVDLLAVYNHPQQELRGSAFYWNLGAQHKRVGLTFYSLGNVGQATDRMLDQVFGELNWGGWSMGGQLSREMDNIDDDPRFPHLYTDNAGIWTQYTPLDMPQQTGIMRIFSNPTLTVTGNRVMRNYEDIPATFAGDDINETVDLFTVTFNFAPGSWYWSIAQTYEKTREEAGPEHDLRRDNTHLDLSVPLTEHLNLGSGLDYDRTRDLDDNSETETYLGNLYFSLNALENRLRADLSYNYQREDSDSAGVNSDYTIQASTSWIAVEARPNRPSLALFVNGSYAHDQDSYEVFAGVTVDWQGQY